MMKPGNPNRQLAYSPPKANQYATLVIFSDACAARHAMERYEHWLMQHGERCGCQTRCWRFDGLESPETHDLALDAAGQAGMLVVAAPAATGVSPRVVGWIREALARFPERPAHLLAIIGHEGTIPEECSMHQALRQAAADAGAEFMADWYTLPVAAPHPTREDFERRAEAVTPLLEDILHSTESFHVWHGECDSVKNN